MKITEHKHLLLNVTGIVFCKMFSNFEDSHHSLTLKSLSQSQDLYHSLDENLFILCDFKLFNIINFPVLNFVFICVCNVYGYAYMFFFEQIRCVNTLKCLKTYKTLF